MSYALHVGYESCDAASARDFVNDAPAILHLDELVAAFAQVVAGGQGTGHMCCVVEEDGGLYPVFGDMPALAHSTGAETIPVEAPDGTPLAVLIDSAAPIDRQFLSRLRFAANVFATHGVTLLEAADEIPAEGLSDMERGCLGLTVSGWSHLDIGERYDRSAPAIGVHIRRAMARLDASSVAEAVLIAAARGLMSQ